MFLRKHVPLGNLYNLTVGLWQRLILTALCSAVCLHTKRLQCGIAYTDTGARDGHDSNEWRHLHTQWSGEWRMIMVWRGLNSPLGNIASASVLLSMHCVLICER